MIRFVILLYICVSVLSFSTSCSRQDTQLPDEINHRAYLLRYTDVDSSLNCAKTAFKQSELYPDGRAEALNHIAFAQFQQMRFSKAQFTLRKIDSLTNNQVELLCADVMNMKISQRELADRMQLVGIDIDKNAIQRIECGKRFVTDIEIIAFSKVFNKSFDEILKEN